MTDPARLSPVKGRPVVLLRCSTANQDLEFRSQRAELGKLLEERGVVVAPEDWREEAAIHGAASKRPVLDRIRAEAEAKEISHLYATDFDRLGRAGEETAFIVWQLVQSGVTLVLARYPTMDHRTPLARTTRLLMAAVGILKLDIVSTTTAWGFTDDPLNVPEDRRVHPRGVRVSRKGGKRVGRPPIEIEPVLLEELRRRRAHGASIASLLEGVTGVVRVHHLAADDDPMTAHRTGAWTREERPVTKAQLRRILDGCRPQSDGKDA